MPASQGAPAQATFTPAADQSTVKHLRLTVISVTPLHPHGLHLQVRCGDVGFPVTITSPGAPAIRPGDALVTEHRKGDNPLTCQPTAIYPAHQKPEPRKEPAVNLAIATSTQTITMTSLELVDYINSQRGEGESELRHDNFMAKVPKVLGEAAPKFLGTAFYTNGTGAQVERTIYRFPKREACLMAMSYSYDLQAKVFDRMTALEQQAAQGFTIPQTMGEALRLAADLAEQRDQLALENKAQAAALADAQPKVAGFDLITAGEKSITIREAAKLLGIKENRLTSWLHEHGWTYRLNGRWVAKQEHIQGGRLIYKEAKYTDEKTGHEVYAPYCHITPKGLAKLARAFGSSPEELTA